MLETFLKTLLFGIVLLRLLEGPISLDTGICLICIGSFSLKFPIFSSLHFSASINGGTVMRPLFFEFPEDEQTWGINYEFLWGDKILVMPVVYQVKKELSPTCINWPFLGQRLAFLNQTSAF